MGPLAEPVWLHNWVPENSGYGNADALSRLPSGDDINFNGEESGEEMDMVCAIKGLSLQIQPVDANILRQEYHERSCDIYSVALHPGRVAIKEHWDQLQSKQVPEVVGLTQYLPRMPHPWI